MRRLHQLWPSRWEDLLRADCPNHVHCFPLKYPPILLDSLAVGCRFEPAVGGTSEALRVCDRAAVLPIREGKCLPGVFATNGQ